MKKFVIMASMLLFLVSVGVAGAQNIPQAQPQMLLPGANILKFVDPLPLGDLTDDGISSGITVVNATQTIFGAPGAGYTPSVTSPFSIVAREFKSQIVPDGTCGVGTSASSVWGYLTANDISGLTPTTVRPSFLGPVVVAEKGVPFYPFYGNELPAAGSAVLANLPIDMTLDWANPESTVCDPGSLGYWTNLECGTIPPYDGPVPIATHLHGGEVGPAFDGGPDAWFTQDGPGQITGAGFPGNVYEYLNDQQESTIWFHDHALGITRLNVYAGLAGVYPILDPNLANAPLAAMPAFPQYDIPLIIQDRSFDTNCQIFYNLASNPQPNPDVHPYWIPEFIGDTIVVNGKTWPYLDVEPRQYRFRLVNGSNARFYTLSLDKGAKFFVIATDDGYLANAVQTNMLNIGPGERYEVIVDFGKVMNKGRVKKALPVNVTMLNSAATPFPAGGPVIPNLTDTVMQFRVATALAPGSPPDTNIGNGTPIRSTPLYPIANGFDPVNGIRRQLTLNEVIGPGGPLELVVNNSKFNLVGDPITSPTVLGGRETELPAVGDTEIWEIINISADAHPMHTHLTSFQVIDRTPFNAALWTTQYDALLVANGIEPGHGPPNPYNIKNADGAIGGNPAINAFLDLALRRPPEPYEMGWKDVVIAYPGEVTRIAVRWATTDTPLGGAGVGVNTYPFDPTLLEGGVGYVWHCHIIDHEDNEMMRNYLVQGTRQIP